MEITKIAVPALIVYFTAKHLLSRQLEADNQRLRAQLHSEQLSSVVPMRLQAYERLSVFCERISLSSLLFRLQGEVETAGELRLALLITIQQEYEHNISQQVYMSENLWAILSQARDNVVQAVETISKEVSTQEPASELSKLLIARASGPTDQGITMALSAIKKEAAQMYL